MTFFSSGPNDQVSRSLVNSSCSCCESGNFTVLNKFVVLFTFPELCVPQACMTLCVKCASIGDTVPGVAAGAPLSGHKNRKSVSCHFLQVQLP